MSLKSFTVNLGVLLVASLAYSQAAKVSDAALKDLYLLRKPLEIEKISAIQNILRSFNTIEALPIAITRDPEASKWVHMNDEQFATYINKLAENATESSDTSEKVTAIVEYRASWMIIEEALRDAPVFGTKAITLDSVMKLPTAQRRNAIESQVQSVLQKFMQKLDKTIEEGKPVLLSLDSLVVIEPSFELDPNDWSGKSHVLITGKSQQQEYILSGRDGEKGTLNPSDLIWVTEFSGFTFSDESKKSIDKVAPNEGH